MKKDQTEMNQGRKSSYKPLYRRFNRLTPQSSPILLRVPVGISRIHYLQKLAMATRYGIDNGYMPRYRKNGWRIKRKSKGRHIQVRCVGKPTKK